MIEGILLNRGLSHSQITDAINHLPAREEQQEQAGMKEKKLSYFWLFVWIAIYIVSLTTLAFLGWLAWSLSTLYEQGDPAVRSTYIYGPMFGLVVNAWFSKIKYKIEADTQLHGFPLPLYAAQNHPPEADNWLLYAFNPLVYLANIAINFSFSILSTICFLLYLFHDLSEGYRVIASISLFVLVFSSLELMVRKYGPEGAHIFGRPSPGVMRLLTLLIVPFALFTFVKFNSLGWVTERIIWQIAISAIAIGIVVATIKSRR